MAESGPDAEECELREEVVERRVRREEKGGVAKKASSWLVRRVALGME